MDFDIDQARFLSALTLAQTVADRRSTMPILANVLLRARDDGYVACASTDLMVALVETIPAEIKSTGSLSVSVRHLHAVVRTLPAGPIRFKALDNHWVQIISGRSEFKLMGLPDSDFPDLPEPSKSAKSPAKFVDIPAHAFADLLAKTQFSVSTDDARLNLAGALLESDGETATMVSTDGHRLTKFSSSGLRGLSLDKGVIIPRKGMTEIKRVLDRAGGEVGFLVRDPHLFVKAENLLLSVKLNNVTFPPYKAVIPTSHERTAQLDRDELLNALRRAEVMAPEKTATVRLQLSTNKLELTADNPDLGVAHQELALDYTAEPLTAGFNARYLIEALDVIDTDEVCLEFQGELDPCVIRPVNGPDFIGVVMPMRI